MSGGEPDPPRLLDEGGSEGELRALMRAGKSEVPNEAQMLALAAKLGALGGLGGASAAGAGGAGAGVAAGKAGLAVKVLAALTVIGVAGGGVAIARRKSVEALTHVGIIAASPSASTSPNTGTRPSASTSPNTSTTSSVGTSPGTKTSASAFPSATPAPTNAARPAESPDGEVRLLGRAQDALRGRPEEALALCNDHANRFPAGAFVQEREVIAIQALVETGREGEARARADRFEARFPHSTHTRRIETLLTK